MDKLRYIDLICADALAGVELARDPRLPEENDPLRYFKLIILQREGVISKRTLLEELGLLEKEPA